MRGTSFRANLVLLASAILSQPAFAAGLSQHFQGRFGAIEIFDSQAKLSFRVNPPRLTEALPACGTAHLIIAAAALRQGLLKPEATERDYDALRSPASPDWPAHWQSRLGLETALRQGVPWYFNELQLALGPQLQAHLNRFGLKVSGPAAQWRISPLDQVEWLKKLRSNTIGLSAAAHRSLLAAMEREHNGSEKLYGVGGRCAQDAQYWLAWQVGWVDRGRAPVFYALNAEGKSRADLSGVGRRIAQDALAEMKLWTKAAPPVLAAEAAIATPVAPGATPPATPATPAPAPAPAKVDETP